jgi:hypothetical protein
MQGEELLPIRKSGDEPRNYFADIEAISGV